MTLVLLTVALAWLQAHGVGTGAMGVCGGCPGDEVAACIVFEPPRRDVTVEEILDACDWWQAAGPVVGGGRK